MCRSPSTSPNWLRYGRSAQEQQRLNVRFHGITPQHFRSQGIVICSPPDLAPPPSFHGAWHSIDVGQGLSQDVANLAFCEVLLVLCDLADPRHVQHCSHLMQVLSTDQRFEGEDSPLRLVLSHSQTPTNCGPEFEDAILAAVACFSKLGMEDIVMGELTGMRLVREVCGKVAVARKRADRLSRVINECREASHIEDVNAHTVWQYCRVMLKTRVPDVDVNISPGQPREIGGFKVGAVVAKGFVASVHRLESRENGTLAGQVLKVIAKKQIKALTGLVSLDNQIRMMELLQSDCLQHPNLVKLHAVYHSSSHVSIRMEDAGPLSLHKRLVKRERNGLALSMPQVKSISSQAIAALLHMHLQLKVAHRDIKPENFIVCEAGPTINVKLADFETATFIKTPKLISSNVVGTFPFMAPEMFLPEAKYLILPADMWSLGVLLLEVFCHCKFLESRLLHQKQQQGEDFDDLKMPEKRKTMTAISNIFEAPGSVRCLLEKHMHADIRSFIDDAVLVLDGLLQVSVEQRSDASQLMEAESNW